MVSEEGQTPPHRAPCLLRKVVQLGSYKSPEADILISFLMSCINAIQAELSWCRVSTCQGRCSASGRWAPTEAGSGMSGRICRLLVVHGKASRGEDKGAAPSVSVCLRVLSELTLGSAGPASREAREDTHRHCGWTGAKFLDIFRQRARSDF